MKLIHLEPPASFHLLDSQLVEAVDGKRSPVVSTVFNELPVPLTGIIYLEIMMPVEVRHLGGHRQRGLIRPTDVKTFWGMHDRLLDAYLSLT